MNLVTRFLAARRDKLLMKLGCWLVCFSLVLGLMFPQQRAEAVGTLTIAAVASVAAAYLGACGLTFITQGMDRDALVSATQRLIQEFLDTELGGKSIQEWLGSIWDVAVLAGKIIMGRPLTEEFVSFAQWVAQKYGAQVGENVVYSDYGIKCADGSMLYLSTWHFDDPSQSKIVLDSLGSPLPFEFSDSSGTSTEILLTNGYSLKANASPSGSYQGETRYSMQLQFYLNGSKVSRLSNIYVTPTLNYYTFTLYSDGLTFLTYCYSGSSVGYVDVNLAFLTAEQTAVLLSGTDLSIDRAPSMSYIPESIKEGEGVALDVGAEKTMDLDQVCQGVLDDVIAGELTSTMTAADEKTEPVDPPAEELPDVGELGLPALGAALTSRFPFSIPWDFFRAVQLLAAPAKAPRFEVDFMEPIEHRVGQWQGDTTVILDFSEYAIIGQISRWTSTIGFCLMLAVATKRLIWTA